MKFKKIMLMTLLLLAVLTIGAVSASDDMMSDDSLAVDSNGTVIDIVDDEDDSSLGYEDEQSPLSHKNYVSRPGSFIYSNSFLITVNADNGTFTALQNKIDNAAENTTVYLENNYSYVDDEVMDSRGVVISKSLTIDGRGHTVDANSKSVIFYINGTNVTLKNIVFINGNATVNRFGGALDIQAANCQIISCIFEDCYAPNGGAIHVHGANCRINQMFYRLNKHSSRSD